MHKLYWVLILFLLNTVQLSAQDSLTLLFTGDIMGHDSQIKSAYDPKTKQYDYSEVFQYVQPYFDSADLVIGNLEVTLGLTPYKGYPSFSSPAALASGLKEAGFDVLVTANNHSCDRRKKGVIKTLDILDTLNLVHTGTFRNQAEKDKTYPLLLEKNGFKLALLNYTYGTNGIPVEAPTIVNKIDNVKIKSDLEKAKTMGVDKIIVFVHWGKEYQLQADKKQTALTQFMFSNGADIVIGSHPHVVQPMEMNPTEMEGDHNFVVYSMGNFISNQRKINTDGGAMVRLTLVKKESAVNLVNAEGILTWVYPPYLNGKKRFFILPVRDFELKEDFFLGLSEYEKMRLFMNNTRTRLNKDNKGMVAR